MFIVEQVGWSFRLSSVDYEDARSGALVGHGLEHLGTCRTTLPRGVEVGLPLIVVAIDLKQAYGTMYVLFDFFIYCRRSTDPLGVQP